MKIFHRTVRQSSIVDTFIAIIAVEVDHQHSSLNRQGTFTMGLITVVLPMAAPIIPLDGLGIGWVIGPAMAISLFALNVLLNYFINSISSNTLVPKRSRQQRKARRP